MRKKGSNVKGKTGIPGVNAGHSVCIFFQRNEAGSKFLQSLVNSNVAIPYAHDLPSIQAAVTDLCRDQNSWVFSFIGVVSAEIVELAKLGLEKVEKFDSVIA